MRHRIVFLIVVILIASQTDAAWTAGVDLSSLPDLEAAGAVYRDVAGKPGDAIAILKDHGVNLVRLRLFVNPSHDFNATIGADQDLPMVLGMTRRARGAGLGVLLDLHYSDTWADPKHQITPAAWARLSPGELAKRVEAYTTDVLRQVRPDAVAVGNEINTGMLWPTGKLDKTEASWDRLTALLSAGVRGARSVDPKIRVMIHVSGGGYAGGPTWFFDHLDQRHVDYDVVGVSFYPTWNDDIGGLRKNLAELGRRGKDVVVAEIGYPWRGAATTPQCHWPTTPAGQAACLADVTAAVRAMPGGHGLGVIWWYPEATPVAGLRVWEHGRLGLFDDRGTLLPAGDGLR
jgi:arabinogalactan endo-1,4-beta-galactosidase